MNERIQRVMAQAFECGVEQITVTSSQNDTPNWDSLHHVKLIVLLEREFDVVIPDERVGNMISYEFIKTVIDECSGS